jgi:DNA-binding transcriptional MerR regulator
MAMVRTQMKLIECARASGVSGDTLRHYLREGLVKAESRTDGGYRTFSSASVARVRFIRSALALGFSLKEVAELIGMSESGELPCPRARALLEAHIEREREHLDATQRLYKRMRQAMREWRLKTDGVPDGHSICGLIEGSFAEHEAAEVPALVKRRMKR